MFRTIKSEYFQKAVLSILNERTKLKIIKYNNNFKNMMNINLINYKILSNKCIIYEIKGKGKEYIYTEYSGELIFEGEYLDGKRHGNGKEYDYNNLIFEGKYLNGKRHGKGKEYYLLFKEQKKINILKFEGEFFNGKKWNGKQYEINNNKIYEIKNGKGFIKEFHFDGEIIYESEYLNGEKTGKVKEYHKNGKLKFEGEYLNGQKNGKGKEYYKYGDLKFEGEYLNGEKNGKGKDYNDNGKLIFEGEYINGKKHEEGKG